MHIQRLKIILNSNIFLILIVLLALIKIIYSINNVESKYKKGENIITGIVTNIEENDKKTIITISSKENIIVYYYNNISINLGDKIKIKGQLQSLEENTNFNLFNYKKYMLSKNTYFKMNAENIKLVSKNKNILYKLKTYLINRIDKINKSEYLKVFVLGDNSCVKKEVKLSYSINGISHLFSISGMHITLLSSIILFVLNKIKKSNINYIIVILVLLIFAFLTNFTPSVIRATALFIFIYLNKLLKLNLSTIKIFIIILAFVLIFNPYNIYNVGFLFSYIISLYLICFNKIINRYKNYFVKLIFTSFISYLASIPILINNFFSINLLTILNNIIFVPFVSIIIFPFSLIVLIIPKLDFLFSILINILENISLFMNNIRIEIILKKVNIFIILFYYLIITFILYMILKNKYKYILILIIVLFIHTNINYIVKTTYITFQDVGQGDSIFVHSNNKNVIIDTGGNINYDISSNIINYLKSEGIKKIDYLILTHGDFDHMGEAINIVNNFKVEKVIINCGEFNELEQSLIKVLNKNKIPFYSCIEKINIDKYQMQFLNTKIYDNENDNSSVIYIKLGGYKFMFMADAGLEKEKDILDKYNIFDIDVLKVGHHGSKTSSSKYFIDTIKPKYSIISVGKNNRYGHPNDSVLDNLEDSKIYRTDSQGSIMFKIKNNKLKIKICNSTIMES